MKEEAGEYAGANIVRHAERQSPFEPAFGDGESIEAIGNHIEKHIGPIESVFHEIISDLVHIDLHWVKPQPGRPFNTLVTSGMSDRPMSAPPHAEAFRFAELLLNLPASWPMQHEAWSDERNYWPIRLLKVLARLPHEYNTWLFADHTVGEPKGPPYDPSTRQNCALIAPCISGPPGFDLLDVSPSKRIHFLSVVPLYPEEIDFKLRNGAEALYDQLEAAGVGDVVDPVRSSAITSPPPRSGWRKWFRA